MDLPDVFKLRLFLPCLAMLKTKGHLLLYGYFGWGTWCLDQYVSLECSDFR